MPNTYKIARVNRKKLHRFVFNSNNRISSYKRTMENGPSQRNSCAGHNKIMKIRVDMNKFVEHTRCHTIEYCQLFAALRNLISSQWNFPLVENEGENINCIVISPRSQKSEIFCYFTIGVRLNI